LRETFPNPAAGAFDHFGFSVAAGPLGLLVGAPGPSRVYLFRSPNGAATAQAAPAAIRATPLAAAGGRRGGGVAQPRGARDDGNTVDLDDCRSDCSRPVCCTLDPLAATRCDDGNPCTDDLLDPVNGCVHVANAGCCTNDSACAGGTCRICVGCFLHRWDCCAT